jgi:hypothetical protein
MKPWTSTGAFARSHEGNENRLYQGGGGYTGIKYMDWLCGGNGVCSGSRRQIAPQAMQAMRAGIKAIGVTPREDDEDSMSAGELRQRNQVKKIIPE